MDQIWSKLLRYIILNWNWYLNRLQQRPKWLKEIDNAIKVGSLVLVKDDNLPPGKWSLARVVNVHPGDDGLVRVVSLKYKNTVVKRPITKVCMMPVDV